MTIICALSDVESNCVWLGFNDQSQVGNIVPPGLDNKWVWLGEWTVGVVGVGPRSEALKSHASSLSEKKNIIELTRAMREAFSDFGFSEDDEGVKRFCGSGIIVNRDGDVWDYDGALSLSAIRRGEFWARGSAMDMAIGACKAFQSSGAKGVDLMRRTLSIVVENDRDCPGSPCILRLGREGDVEVAVGDKDALQA